MASTRTETGNEAATGGARPARAAPPLVAGDWALFLDLDGTLLDIAARPGDVKTPRGLPERLARLGRALDGRLAVVSGRRIAEIDRLLAPLRGPAAGLHGSEFRLQGEGRVERLPAPSGSIAVRRRFTEIVHRHPGSLLEDKGPCIALHYRGAPELEPQLRAAIGSFMASLPPAFELIEAKMAFEIRPRGLDKGLAVRRFMGEPGWSGARPVFVGDDVTDQDGFAAARELGGLAIAVGDRPEGADFLLPAPRQVREWLRQSLARLGNGA